MFFLTNIYGRKANNWNNSYVSIYILPTYPEIVVLLTNYSCISYATELNGNVFMAIRYVYQLWILFFFSFTAYIVILTEEKTISNLSVALEFLPGIQN